MVLVDFFPMGKRDELANAIRELADLGSHVHIALGLRGIVDSPQFALQDNLSKKIKHSLIIIIIVYLFMVILNSIILLKITVCIISRIK